LAEGYETRRQAVRVGKNRATVLVAAFPLAAGGEVLFQLADEGDLRRGGVYLLASSALASSDEAARAPRFDELFRDVASKARSRSLGRALRPLVERAQKVACATRPTLTPRVLGRIVKLAAAAAALDRRHVDVPGLPVETLILALALVFASEEERYPRPRYKGSDVARERLLELLEAWRPRGDREGLAPKTGSH
jgi:hypothetical protein